LGLILLDKIQKNLQFYKCCSCGASPCGARARPSRAHPHATDQVAAPKDAPHLPDFYFFSYFSFILYHKILCVGCLVRECLLVATRGRARDRHARPPQPEAPNQQLQKFPIFLYLVRSLIICSFNPIMPSLKNRCVLNPISPILRNYLG